MLVRQPGGELAEVVDPHFFRPDFSKGDLARRAEPERTRPLRQRPGDPSDDRSPSRACPDGEPVVTIDAGIVRAVRSGRVEVARCAALRCSRCPCASEERITGSRIYVDIACAAGRGSTRHGRPRCSAGAGEHRGDFAIVKCAADRRSAPHHRRGAPSSTQGQTRAGLRADAEWSGQAEARSRFVLRRPTASSADPRRMGEDARS